MSSIAPKRPRALIAEDEPLLVRLLKEALGRLWPELEIVATCLNGIDALAKALVTLPDVIFLDIKMPGKNGLKVAEELGAQWPAGSERPLIVFLTAYDEFAVDAFVHAAADYLVKPVDEDRLMQTAARLRERLAPRLAPAPTDGAGAAELTRLLARLEVLVPEPPMPVPAIAAPTGANLTLIRAAVGNEVRIIPIDEVFYFEALDRYVNVVTRDTEALIRMSLKELLPQLDGNKFWQIHRGTIVCALRIESAIRDERGLVLKLSGRAERLRVGPLYTHLFRQM
ncbi:LytR/AlgR family response regulator transcription factor [Roseateles oligotrophus]|uniref:LytTR family DNA-binding domain-containing protein n=1 Tax=Roseateles oligotrophus TaxID=1769250 RepID=A0ABT2YKY1_9BURK|nr:LytTR family DNA-binding domain-containing protein [Roseateles oligotrophus]MCV2370730.1 LytTR family DNA-binding domain-containing protein [Roseateles oligotrophus]